MCLRVSAKTKDHYSAKQCFESLDRNKYDLSIIKAVVLCHYSIKCS